MNHLAKRRMHILCASLPLEVDGISDTKTTCKAHTLVVWNDSHFAYSFRASKHTDFFQSTKPFVFWQLSFIRSSYLGTWPLIVSFVDVFGYTKTCTCLRCEQGFKNEKLVTTKFSNFLQTLTLFFCHSANRTLVWQVRSDKINGKHPQRELTVIKLMLYLQVWTCQIMMWYFLNWPKNSETRWLPL